MRELRYVQNNGSTTNEVATILLYDPIGYEFDVDGNICGGIDGSRFAAEMQYLVSAGVKQIDIRINSYGGNIIDGFSIVSAIIQAKNKGVEINTYVDGMAFSIAGVIAVMGQKRFISDFGTVMVHNPSGPDKKFLEILKENLITIISNNSPLSAETLFKMMDEETFFTPSEAIAAGLVDEIFTSGRELVVDKTNIREMFNQYKNALNPNQLEMTENKNTVGPEDFSDLQKKVEDLTNALEGEKTAKAVLESKLKTIEDAEAAKKENETLEMVNSFIELGAITPEEKESTLTLAKADFKACKNMLTKLSDNKPLKIMDVAKTKYANNSNPEWTLEDFRKKDPDALLKIQAHEPERFKHLLNAYSNSNK